MKKGKTIENLSKEECCGCTACQSICPRSAISMNPDEKGFLYPTIDVSRCVGCGLCYTVCPMKHTLVSEGNQSDPDFYAVKHRSDKVRMNSSSGGMFTAISDWILQQGGIVYGASFNDDFSVSHHRAENIQQRDLFRGSKYVQSNMGKTFLKVKDDLSKNRMVLFSGTPCQVAGLYSFLNRNKVCTDQLFLCDLICHGVPSPKIWRDYIKFISKKYKSNIKSFLFRNKEYGWRGYNTKIIFQNGLAVTEGMEINSYSNLFGLDLILRSSCYHCPFTRVRRYSDLTIGDFWGIENSMPDFEDKMGVSLVLVHTKRGEYLFQKVSNDLEKRFLMPEQGMQWNLKRPSVKSPKADAFWKDYQKYGFEFVEKKYSRGGINGTIKNFTKQILKRLGLLETAKAVLRR